MVQEMDRHARLRLAHDDGVLYGEIFFNNNHRHCERHEVTRSNPSPEGARRDSLGQCRRWICPQPCPPRLDPCRPKYWQSPISGLPKAQVHQRKILGKRGFHVNSALYSHSKQFIYGVQCVGDTIKWNLGIPFQVMDCFAA